MSAQSNHAKNPGIGYDRSLARYLRAGRLLAIAISCNSGLYQIDLRGIYVTQGTSIKA